LDAKLSFTKLTVGNKGYIVKLNGMKSCMLIGDYIQFLTFELPIHHSD